MVSMDAALLQFIIPKQTLWVDLCSMNINLSVRGEGWAAVKRTS